MRFGLLLFVHSFFPVIFPVLKLSFGNDKAHLLTLVLNSDWTPMSLVGEREGRGLGSNTDAWILHRNK